MASRNRYIKNECVRRRADACCSSKEPTQRVIHAVRSESSSHVPNQLDLRGKRYEEALSEVDQYLILPFLAGYPQVTIVHGKGTGALRKELLIILKTIGVSKALSLHRQTKAEMVRQLLNLNKTY